MDRVDKALHYLQVLLVVLMVVITCYSMLHLDNSMSKFGIDTFFLVYGVRELYKLAEAKEQEGCS